MSRIIDFAAPVGQKAGPGKWNDLDMLEVGIGGMTFDEYGTSLPCMAPIAILTPHFLLCQSRTSPCGHS